MDWPSSGVPDLESGAFSSPRVEGVTIPPWGVNSVVLVARELQPKTDAAAMVTQPSKVIRVPCVFTFNFLSSSTVGLCKNGSEKGGVSVEVKCQTSLGRHPASSRSRTLGWLSQTAWVRCSPAHPCRRANRS